MKTTFLTLLALGVLVTGCNEKVSPDLDTGATATSDTAVAPDVYTFEVVNDSPTMLNYKLHRTGPARGATECKISRSGAPLNNTQYTGESVIAHDSKNYDITCFLEAEELSLYFSGIDFAVKSSQNTCDYIGYSPYSYFNFQPGSSTTTLTRVTCNGAANPAAALPADGGGLVPTYGAAVKLGCGQVLDSSVSTPIASSSPAEDQALCKYDYSSGEGPNCDTGTVTVNEVVCSIDDGPPTKTVCSTAAQTKVVCGGKVVNCVDGPIKKVTSLSTLTSGTEITESELNKVMEIKYSLAGGIEDQRLGNFHIANYRRDLANQDVSFVDRDDLGYKSSFTPYLRAFNPLLMESYARNQKYGGASTDLMIPSGDITAFETAGAIKTKPFAADPILGLSGNRVNPFYTFYCFDRAFDIKARIRMVVRDWDRVFSSDTTELEKLTDLVISEPRQDNGAEEVTFDPGNYNAFNDKPDWDDMIPMKRSPAGVGTTATTWEPMADFFNPDNFPQE